MAQLDSPDSSRDRDIEAMAQHWTDLSARYDLPPAWPAKKRQDFQPLKPNDEDDYVATLVFMHKRLKPIPERDWPTLF